MNENNNEENLENIDEDNNNEADIENQEIA